MGRPLRIALAQLYSTPELQTNLENLEKAVHQAAQDNCQIIVFPEYYAQGIVADAPHKVFKDTEVRDTVRELAKKAQIDIVIGTLVEKLPVSKDQDAHPREHKTFNT
jgi:predicted amidohydrolase